jgi:hypothetical protein
VGDNGAGADKSIFPNGYPAHDCRIGADRRSALYQGIPILGRSGNFRAGIENIGKDAGGTAKDPVFEDNVIIHRNIVLDFDPIADPHAVTDKDILPKRAVFTENGTAANMGPMPYTAAGANPSPLIDDRSVVPCVVAIICHRG